MRSWNCRRPSWLHYDFSGDKQLAFVFSLSFRSVLLTWMWTMNTTNEWSDKSKWNTIKWHSEYAVYANANRSVRHCFMHTWSNDFCWLSARFVSVSYSVICVAFSLPIIVRIDMRTMANKLFLCFAIEWRDKKEINTTCVALCVWAAGIDNSNNCLQMNSYYNM